MDEEILEDLNENPFHHQEEMVASLLDENENEQDFNDDSHIPSSDVDENLQQSCQYFEIKSMRIVIHMFLLIVHFLNL